MAKKRIILKSTDKRDFTENLSWNLLKLTPRKRNFIWKFDVDKHDLYYTSRYINFVLNKNELVDSGRVTLYPIPTKIFLQLLLQYFEKNLNRDSVEAGDFFFYFWPFCLDVRTILEKLIKVYEDHNILVISGDGSKLEGHIYKRFIDCHQVIIMPNHPNFDANLKMRVYLDERELTNLAQMRYGTFLKFADKSDFTRIIIELFGKKLSGVDINIPAMLLDHISNTDTAMSKIDTKFDSLKMSCNKVPCVVNSMYMQDSYKIVLCRSIHENFDFSYEITHWGVSHK